MKKYIKLVFTLVAVFILGLFFWQIKERYTVSNSDSKEFIQNNFSNLKIGSEENVKSFDISDFVGKTALEATQSKSKVITTGTGTGAFVTSIDGREADTTKHEFWELLVNSSQAKVGVGTYIIQNHDEIQWKISNY